MTTTKIFKVAVLDESTQSNRIMDIKGFSNFSGVTTTYLAGHNYAIRYAYFRGWTSKAALQAEVRKTLGGAFWSSTNIVELYAAL